jgi:hypothetical protein
MIWIGPLTGGFGRPPLCFYNRDPLAISIFGSFIFDAILNGVSQDWLGIKERPSTGRAVILPGMCARFIKNEK